MTASMVDTLGAIAARAHGRPLGARIGKVLNVVGLAVEAGGLDAAVGDIVEIEMAHGARAAEVIGFRGARSILLPLGDVTGVPPGSPVRGTQRRPGVPVSPALLGRVVDAFGAPVDGGPPLPPAPDRPLHDVPPPALARRRISEPLETGVRAIDGLLPLGRGQRIGIFAGSGVGKSTLLGMIAGHGEADVNVIALVGERGREVREFVERDLGAGALARSIVVVATSDTPALVRRQAAWTATAIAEYFRDAGRRVLLMMDSVTRFAMAQREVGLAAGEPPATRGYPPSVWAVLPRLLERAGTTAHGGSITALYTVLVEGDDLTEPVADTVRSILDGHVVLSRELADAGHHPAIDVLASVSRLADELTPPAQARAAAGVRECLALWRDVRDLVAVGAYVPGADARTDGALRRLPDVHAFLRQARDERTALPETRRRLDTLGGGAGS